jgi:hypothetical protein
MVIDPRGVQPGHFWDTVSRSAGRGEFLVGGPLAEIGIGIEFGTEWDRDRDRDRDRGGDGPLTPALSPLSGARETSCC